jgi:hypothetical protein
VTKSNALQPLLLELTETVSEQKVKPGDTVHFRVIENFVKDGMTIIAKRRVSTLLRQVRKEFSDFFV